MIRNFEIEGLLNSKPSTTFNDKPGMYTSIIPTGHEEFEIVNITKRGTKGKLETLSPESEQADFSVTTVILIRHSMHRHLEDNLVIK